MAFENTNAIVKSAAVDAAFVPELWSDEVIAAYKKNLVMANLVRKLNHRGKKGDSIYIPRPSRALATRRSSLTTPYTVSPLAYADDTRITVPIDKHTEYSRLFDDFAQVQSLESMRRFFVDDAGYSISQAVDTDLINEQLAVAFSAIVWDTSANPNFTLIDNSSTYTANSAQDGAGADIAALTTSYAAIADAGIRAAVRKLDLQDAPLSGRSWVIRPEVKEDLLGLSRFTEEAFVGERAAGNSIRNGLVGNTYGVDVFVTNQLPRVEHSVTEDLAVGNVSLFFHQDAEVLVEQMGMRTQRQYKQEFLADLLTSDMIYGVKNLRDGSIIPMITG